MIVASVYYLGITLLFFLIFAVIVARIYHPARKEQGERAKYRMMDDEEQRKETAKEDNDAR